MIKILIILLASYNCVNLSEGQIAGPAAKNVPDKNREIFESQVLVETLSSWPQENYNGKDIDGFLNSNYVFTPIGSGTIIHKRFVLTAAHLFDERTVEKDRRITYRKTTEDVRVMVGSLNKQFPRGRYSVQKVRIHHGYKTGDLGNDIALLQLRFPLDIDKVINLGVVKEERGQKCLMSGWGYPQFGQPRSDRLRFSKIFVASRYEKDLFYVNAKDVSNREELAVLMTGDSGGGLLCLGERQGKQETLLVGVAKGRFNQDDEAKDLQNGSLFTSVHDHMYWIRNEMNEMDAERGPPRSNQGSLISRSDPPESEMW